MPMSVTCVDHINLLFIGLFYFLRFPKINFFRLERFEQAATAMEVLLISHPELVSAEATADAQTCIVQVSFISRFCNSI